MKVNSVAGADGALFAADVDDSAKTSGAGFSNYISQESLSYGDYLEQIFQKAADTYQVSKDLLKAMAKAESNFQANATSSAGAMGIMQLMPGTAAGLGVRDAYNPEQNIMGGAKYISQLLEKYNGNLSYAIAAYNAGSGNVDKYGGIPPFKETRNYVIKVLQYMDEGVKIPNSTQSAASGSQVTSVDGGTLQNIFNKYFDYDDYLEFLQLFTKVIYEKVTGTKLKQTAEAETYHVDEQPVQEEEPEKRLMMRVRDSYGRVNTFQQDDSNSESSDAYIAYQSMSSRNQNRLAVLLNKTAVE